MYGICTERCRENKENSKEICTLSRGCRALQHWTEKVDFSNVKIEPIFKKLLKFMLDDGERKDRTAMESNDTASGMPYMAYIRHQKDYVNIPLQGLLMSELSDIIKASYQ